MQDSAQSKQPRTTHASVESPQVVSAELHQPPVHWSFAVQASPSSQAVPSGAVAPTHAPWMQSSSTVHGSSSTQGSPVLSGCDVQ
ncbi:MAG: hypothetical protein IPM79_23965 [Polyangiaceae bacterium]|nr:hypothetical protein [Polyangiaceae bacterium]